MLTDYGEMTGKEVPELVVKFKQCMLADGHIVILAKVIKNIRALCFWA